MRFEERIMAKPSLLIVDDEPHLLKSLSSILEEEFHVMTASNGRDGLSIIKANPLSLILLDLQMPEMTGVELLEKVRNTDNKTPILIITGNSCHEWAEKCADLNVQGYVKKPLDIGRLIDRIKDLLGVEDFEVLIHMWGDEYEAKMASVSHPIRKALRYIHQNYQGELTREKISNYLNISPDYLSRQFHKECGVHLKEYINRYKIHKSKEHFRDLDRQMSDIASSVGFLNVNYFCKLFKDYTGITPKVFRKNSSIISPR